LSLVLAEMANCSTDPGFPYVILADSSLPDDDGDGEPAMKRSKMDGSGGSADASLKVSGIH
jgi:hypothetical protein